MNETQEPLRPRGAPTSWFGYRRSGAEMRPLVSADIRGGDAPKGVAHGFPAVSRSASPVPDASRAPRSAVIPNPWHEPGHHSASFCLRIEAGYVALSRPGLCARALCFPAIALTRGPFPASSGFCLRSFVRAIRLSLCQHIIESLALDRRLAR